MRTVDWQALVPSWLSSTLLHGVLIVDTAFTVRFWNDWMQQHSGLAAARALGRPLLELYPDLRQRGLVAVFERARAGEQVDLATGAGYLLKMPAPGRPDLPAMLQEARVGPLVLDGQIVGVIVTIADRTGQAPADIPQELIFGLLDTALAHAPVGFGVIDSALRFRVVNARLAEYNGYTVEQHLGRTFADLFPDWNALIEPVFRKVLSDGQSVIGMPISGERHARPEEVAHWQASYFPIELADARRIGVGMLIEDMTEQKRDEAAKSFLAELSTSLAESLDYQATLQRLARSTVPDLADWCALELCAEGERFSAFAHSDPQQVARADQLQRNRPPPAPPGQAGATLTAGRPLLLASLSPAVLDAADIDAGSRHLLRRLRPNSCIVVSLRSGDEPIGAMLLARNAGRRTFTRDDMALAEEIVRRAVMALENVRLYAAAQHSRVLAEDAVRVRDAFFSIAAHELRTPLTTLLGRAQMLQRRLTQQAAGDDRSQRTIQIIVAQAQRLNKMITALLDVSRIQTGRFTIDPLPMDLSALVRRVVDESRLTITDRALTLQAPDAPLDINGDEVRLEQMLQNLISNAVKYSPSGGPVDIVLSRQDSWALVTVADQGIGISSEAQRQLFHRFYRAENAENYGIGGMGIGLFVVKEIVELHGGSVAVRSAEGQGSAFTVRLPLRDFGF